MDAREIAKTVDHTLLRQCTTTEEIRALCDEAVRYGAASVCVPPCHVSAAARFLRGALPVCTVIGFPNGYNTTDVKCFETTRAVKDGAGEIDMVINLGLVREGRFDAVEEEIRAVRACCPGLILKVIIETCLLTQEEKCRLCRVVSDAGADYIKTSTGFAGGGATAEDVALLRRECPPGLKIKAAGGIGSLEEAETFLRLGADRLGTSKVIRLIRAGEEG